MFNSLFRFCSLLFLVCFAASSLAADEMLPRVLNIEIIPQNLGPTTPFHATTITGQMQTKVGALFSQTEFDNDLKKLAADYDTIEPNIHYDDNGVIISLKVWIKPTIRSITFVGNAKISTDALFKALEMKALDLFDRETFYAGINKIKNLYLKKSFFEATLCYELNDVVGQPEVDIVINISEGRAGYIVKIEFEGFTKEEECELRDLIVTKKYFTWLSWYNGQGCYHPEMVEYDRGIILSYLQNHGYADATVEVRLRDCSAKNRVVLTFEATHGIPYYMGDITVEGNCLFSRQQIEDCFEICQGGIYSPEGLRNTVKAIRDLYGRVGFIDAFIDTELKLHADQPIYDVTFIIEEGKPFQVGMIRVFGNCRTQSRVILNETLLCPGEVFDICKLEGTEERLANTGFFKEVNAYAVRTERDNEGCRDVFIEVEEQDTGNLGIFFGFNSLQSVFGGIDITERNFNALGIFDIPRCGISALRGAGEYLHIKASIGKRETSYLLQWTLPYFLDTPWILGFDVEKTINRELSKGYTVKTYGGDVHATYIFNDFLKHDTYYRARHSQTLVNGKPRTSALKKEGEIAGFVSALGSTFLYDSTDSARRPTCGLRSKLLYEIAGIGGNFEFMKFAYFNSFYYPLSKRGTIKFRADAQFIHTYGHTRPTTLPLSERLFLGGDTTVRGYRPFIIGPKFANNEPRGGVSSYLLSEEYQYNLLECPCLDFFTFVDAGYVSLKEFSLGRPAAAVGCGIRIEVIKNMPMTFGYGVPIHPIERTRKGGRIDNSQRFFFAFGGVF